MSLIWGFLNDAMWSAVAALGFAMLFNVPKRTLWGCALAGAVGHGVRYLGLEAFDLPIETATFFGAVTVGGASVMLARRLRAPLLIFSVTGAIPMVPGVFAYRAMLGFIELAQTSPEDGTVVLVEAMSNLVQTGLVLGAIALGISMPHLLFRRVKPVA